MKRLGIDYETLARSTRACLRQHLGLRPDRAVGRAPRLRPDGAGDGGHHERHRTSGRAAGEVPACRWPTSAARCSPSTRILSAYIGRREDAGSGQYVDASLFEAAIAF